MISLPPLARRRRVFFFSPGFCERPRREMTFPISNLGVIFARFAAWHPRLPRGRGKEGTERVGERGQPGAPCPLPAHGQRALPEPRARSCPWCCRRCPGAPGAAPDRGRSPPARRRRGARAEAGGGKNKKQQTRFANKNVKILFSFFLMKDDLTTFKNKLVHY